MADKVPYSEIMQRMHGDINYIAEEAYRDGYDHCEKEMRDHAGESYQRGLDDAWKAARKIVTWPDRSLVNSDTFDLDHGESIFTKYSASEAIAKLKAYEEKQKADDEIKVGDEVKWNSDLIVVTRLYEDGGFDWCDGISNDGRAFHILGKNVRKTGRHFDIESILEEMRE